MMIALKTKRIRAGLYDIIDDDGNVVAHALKRCQGEWCLFLPGERKRMGIPVCNSVKRAIAVLGAMLVSGGNA